MEYSKTLETLLNLYQAEHQRLVRNGHRGEEALIEAYNALIELVKSQKYTQAAANEIKDRMKEIRMHVMLGKHPTFTMGSQLKKAKLEQENVQ